MNISNKIYIHPLTYLLFIISIITGMFKELIMVFFIIVTHELGHLMAAKLLKWKTKQIKIYPFGGCCVLEESINRPIKEELFILISGPLFQIIVFTLISILSTKGFITYRNLKIYSNYHYTLLFFNLLPIYPLDGGRIVNQFLEIYFPYKKSNKMTIVLSIIIIVCMLPFYNNLNFMLMIVFLLIELIEYLKKQDYLYNKFLLERFLNNYSFKKEKIIKNKNNMYKDKRHIIYYKNKYLTEKEYLKNRFQVKK